MYSFASLEPVHCSMSGSNCCFLTCIQKIWYSHLFKNFPQFVVIHTVKGFSVVNEADVFLEFSCFLYDPTNVGNLTSHSSAFSKSSLKKWKWSRSVVSDSATPWKVAYQAPPSMGFSRQEYWSGLPFPSPGHLPDPGIKPGSPTLQADSLRSEPPGKPTEYWLQGKKLHGKILKIYPSK